MSGAGAAAAPGAGVQKSEAGWRGGRAAGEAEVGCGECFRFDSSRGRG